MKQLLAYILQLFPQLTAASAREKNLITIVAARDATIATLQQELTAARSAHDMDAQAARVLREKAQLDLDGRIAAEAELASLNAEAAEALAQLEALTADLNANPDVPITDGQVVVEAAAPETATASDAGSPPPADIPPADPVDNTLPPVDATPPTPEPTAEPATAEVLPPIDPV